MLRGLLPVLLAAAFVGGCYSDDGVGYSYGYAQPGLAYVAPGVQVVTDDDYPVFYSDGYYWRFSDGYWYESPYWDRGWSLSYHVPMRLRGIRNPWAYTHYHLRGREGGVWAGRTYRAPSYRGRYRAPAYRAPAYRYRAPAYRAAPTYRRAPAPVYRGARRGPIVRDHRR